MHKLIAIWSAVACWSVAEIPLLRGYCIFTAQVFAASPSKADKTARIEEKAKVLEQEIASLKQKNTRLEKVINQLTSTLDKGTGSSKDEKAGWLEGTKYRGQLIKTGQTTVYQAGDDGTYQKGLAFDFTDNLDGTITDNNTGLMWVKDGTGAGCGFGAAETWANVLGFAETLVFATYDDWRLPNVRELQSIADYGISDPAINTIFLNTQSGTYWSSTTLCYTTTWAWNVGFFSGSMAVADKTDPKYGRPVRGP